MVVLNGLTAHGITIIKSTDEPIKGEESRGPFVIRFMDPDCFWLSRGVGGIMPEFAFESDKVVHCPHFTRVDGHPLTHP
jgi:hypothetical protein